MSAAAVAGAVPSPDPPSRAVAPDEQALVERARTDRAAFGALYRRHVADVYAFAYRRCGSKDVAEEATAATFERALRAIDSFEWREAGIRPWLFRIASNEVAEIYRSRSRTTGARGQRALRLLAPLGQVEEPGVERESDRVLVQRAVDSLSDRHREVITLRYLVGLSTDEAAVALGWSKPLVAVTLHRALRALRDAVEERSTTTGATTAPVTKGGPR